MPNEPIAERGPQPWWRSAVFYEIYVRSFMDANGDGIGDLRGIIQRLDELAAPDGLGVDALWLTPIFPSPQRDFGYDVADYQAVDNLYGDLDTFRELLEEVHRRGLKLILDLPLNHTADTHPWFRESRSSRSNPRRDWYIWRDGKGAKGRKPPNNWASAFGGSAWSWDELTGQWYLHTFLPEQPDLNWRNPQVREALHDVLRFWLDLGVDGFRLDAFNCYFKDAEFRDNPRRISGLGMVYGYAGQRHLRDRDQPELVGALRELRRIADSYPGERVLVGELAAEDDYGKAAVYHGPEGELLHLVFDFTLLRSHWRPGDIQKAALKQLTGLPARAWPSWVIGNHDFPRPLSRYQAPGDARQRLLVATLMQLGLRGTPFLYYGDELGMAEARLSRRELQDPVGRRYWPAFKGRDGCRTPMQWSPEPNAGFTSGKPWLPVQPDYERVNVQVQREDPESPWRSVQAMLALRREHPALQLGSFHLLATGDERVFAFRRELWPEGARHALHQPRSRWESELRPLDSVRVYLNLSHEVVRVELDEPLELAFSTHRAAGAPLRAGSLWLFPYEGLVAVPAGGPGEDEGGEGR